MQPSSVPKGNVTTVLGFTHLASNKKIAFYLLAALLSNFVAWNWFGILILLTFYCLFKIFEEIEHFGIIKAYSIVLLFFILFNYSATYWLLLAHVKYGILANTSNAIYLSVSYFAYRFARQNFKFLFFIITYLLLEINHQYWFLNWGWLNLGNSLGNQPIFIQWYKYSNLFFGTLWILTVSYWFSIESKLRTAKYVLLIFPILCSLVLYVFPKEMPAASPIHVHIINPKYNVYDFDNAHRASYLNTILKKLETSTKTEYVFLPEVYFQSTTLEQLDSLIADSKHIIISGLELEGANRKYYNAFFVKHKKDYLVYKKDKFVPVTEYVPEFLRFIKPTEFNRRDFDDQEKINSSLPFSVLICYESIFNMVVKLSSKNKSTLFVLASEYFSKRSRIAYNQYNTILRVKAIEYNKQIIKVSFEGDNLIINPNGEIAQTLEGELNNITINLMGN